MEPFQIKTKLSQTVKMRYFALHKLVLGELLAKFCSADIFDFF